MFYDKFKREFQLAKKQERKRALPKMRRKHAEMLKAKAELMRKLHAGEIDPREVLGKILGRLGAPDGVMVIEQHEEPDEPEFMHIPPPSKYVN